MIDMYLAVIVCIIGGVLFFILLRGGILPRAKRFPEREELNPDEFYQKYYETSGLPKDQVIVILNIIAYELEMPAGLIRPTDRFAEELAAEPGFEFDDGVCGLAMELDSLLGQKGSNVQTSEILTVDDFVRCMIEHGPVEPQCYNTPILPVVAFAVVVFIVLVYLLKEVKGAKFILAMIFTILCFIVVKIRGAGKWVWHRCC
ncbi:MAG: hypothetical protein HQK99_17810 [Nitrospirae bacterium]|nr:hypothetical protein [Nitrospirota bacterium]